MRKKKRGFWGKRQQSPPDLQKFILSTMLRFGSTKVRKKRVTKVVSVNTGCNLRSSLSTSGFNAQGNHISPFQELGTLSVDLTNQLIEERVDSPDDSSHKIHTETCLSASGELCMPTTEHIKIQHELHFESNETDKYDPQRTAKYDPQPMIPQSTHGVPCQHSLVPKKARKKRVAKAIGVGASWRFSLWSLAIKAVDNHNSLVQEPGTLSVDPVSQVLEERIHSLGDSSREIPKETCQYASEEFCTPVVEHINIQPELHPEFDQTARLPLRPELSCLTEPSVNTPERKHIVQVKKKRQHDLHKLIFMENGLPDLTQLAYRVKGQTELLGEKVGNYVKCNCCQEMFNPSQFEAHAGYPAKRQPYRNIYAPMGLSLHQLSVILSRGYNLTGIYNNSFCSLCHTGGELVPCDGCPNSFHIDCLNLQCLPTTWLCSSCSSSSGTEEKSGVTLSSASKPASKLRRFLEASDKLGRCTLCKESSYAQGFSDRTIIFCEQCEKEYHVGCLKSHRICDLQDLPVGCWFCCSTCKLRE